jgi:hypothetical protein
VRGIAQLHADREIKAGWAAAEASNLHVRQVLVEGCSNMTPAGNYFKFKTLSLKRFAGRLCAATARRAGAGHIMASEYMMFLRMPYLVP